MTAEPTGVEPSYSVMVSPGVPVPLIVGWASLVGLVSAWPALSVMPVTTGLGGATGVPAGTMTCIGSEDVPNSPLLSIAMAVNWCDPALRSAAGVNDQTP